MVDIIVDASVIPTDQLPVDPDVIDWAVMAKRVISAGFVEKYASRLNWQVLSAHYPFTAVEAETYANRIDWDAMSTNTKLPEVTLRKVLDKLDWEVVQAHIPLSPEFIREYQGALEPRIVVRHQHLPHDIATSMVGSNIALAYELAKRDDLSDETWNWLYNTFATNDANVCQRMLRKRLTDERLAIVLKTAGPGVMPTIAQYQKLTNVMFCNMLTNPTEEILVAAASNTTIDTQSATLLMFIIMQQKSITPVQTIFRNPAITETMFVQLCNHLNMLAAQAVRPATAPTDPMQVITDRSQLLAAVEAYVSSHDQVTIRVCEFASVDELGKMQWKSALAASTISGIDLISVITHAANPLDMAVGLHAAGKLHGMAYLQVVKAMREAGYHHAARQFVEKYPEQMKWWKLEQEWLGIGVASLIDQTNWTEAMRECQFPEAVLEALVPHADRISMFWWRLSRYQALTPTFVAKYLPNLDLAVLAKNPVVQLSPEMKQLVNEFLPAEW